MPLLENGKLFGRVSPLLFAIAIVLVAVVFNGIRILSAEEIQQDGTWITVWLEVDYLPKNIAYSIEPGERYLESKYPILKIVDVIVQDSLNPSKSDVLLKLNVLTRNTWDGPHFKDTYIKLWQELIFQTETHSIRGRIIVIGDSLPPAGDKWETVWFEAANVPAEVAEKIAVGQQSDWFGEKVLEVLDAVVLDSANPLNKSIFLKARLLTIEGSAGRVFFDKRVELGQAMNLQIGGNSISAQIISLGDEQPFGETKKVVGIWLEERSSKEAEAAFSLIAEGLTKTDAAGKISAKILEKRMEDGSNGNKIVVVGARLSAIERNGVLFFEGQQLSLLKQVEINFDGLSLRGEILSIED